MPARLVNINFRRSPSGFARRVAGPAVATLVLAGCAANSLENLVIAPRQTEPEAAVSLVYGLNPAAAETLLAAVPTVDHEQRSLQLQIVPAGHNTVRAIVTIIDLHGRSIAYELIVPAAEQHLAVAALIRDNFVVSGGRPTGRAWIELGYGNAAVAKDWTPDPRLDELVERVIRDGRRIAVIHPGPTSSGTGRASVAAPGKFEGNPAATATISTPDTGTAKMSGVAHVVLD